MRKIHVVPLCLLLAIACGGPAAPGQAASSYEQEILDWRTGRLAALQAPTGYLNQTGLFWLKQGRYRFGTGPDNDVVFPGDGAAVIGAFDVTQEGVDMTVEPGVDVRFEERAVEQLLIADDQSDHPVTVTHGSLAWSVVERDGNFAVRLRDFEHPFVADFGPLPYYEIDPALRVPATLTRYDEPRVALSLIHI